MGTWTARQAYGDSVLLLGVGFNGIWRVPEVAVHTERVQLLVFKKSELQKQPGKKRL